MMALGAETSGRNSQKPFGLFVVTRTTVEERNLSMTSVILQTDKQTNQCRQNMTTFGEDNICVHLKTPARLLNSKNSSYRFNYSFVAELRLEKIQGEIYT